MAAACCRITRSRLGRMPGSACIDRLSELADFLRTRRRRLTPLAVGLQARPKRRATGLRREEVAELAGISTAWYTCLEQGRNVNASADVLNSIANVLQLGPDERMHLVQLATRNHTTR